jgi:hypothetical protein
VHLIKSVGVGDIDKLLKRNLACFCCFYLDSNYKKHVNLVWTKDWDVEVLIPNSARYVRFAIEVIAIEDEWDQFGQCGDYLVNYLELGDNFVINVEEGNNEGVEFYIVLCT